MGATKLTSNANTMAKDITHVFSAKTLEVFEIQTDMEVETLSIEETYESASPDFDIVSSVLLESTAIQAQISLCFQEQTLLNIVSNMFDEDYSELTDEILESCGELLNIIFGGAKTTLNDSMGYNTKIAIPRVGTMASSPNSQFTLITFSSPAGEFYLRITPIQMNEGNSNV